MGPGRWHAGVAKGDQRGQGRAGEREREREKRERKSDRHRVRERERDCGREREREKEGRDASNTGSVANGCFWEDHGNHTVLFGTMRVSPGVSDCSVELRTRAFKSSVARSVLSGTCDEK